MPALSETNWADIADQYLLCEKYDLAIKIYEDRISVEPEILSHYWKLGLLYLLQGQELEAQITWSMAIDQGNLETVNEWTQDLGRVILNESLRQEELKKYQNAWTIRQYLREIDPNNFDNLVQIIYLSLHLKILTSESIEDLKIIQILQLNLANINIENQSVLQLSQNILESDLEYDLRVQIVSLALPYIQDGGSFIGILSPIAYKLSEINLDVAVKIINICLQVSPQNKELIGYLVGFHLKYQQYSQALEIARNATSPNDRLIDQILADFCLMNALVSAGGRWDEVLSVSRHQESLIPLLNQQNLNEVSSHLFISRFFAPYLEDNARVTRANQNQISSLCQEKLEALYPQPLDFYKSQNFLKRSRKSAKPLRIGYLSNCLCKHSVGWLARWLLKYHDREQFEIYGYFINYHQNNNSDHLQEWYSKQTYKSSRVGIELTGSTIETCNQISQDGIDILVDLDSITYMNSCEIVSLKPAPIQVNWLGFDASGIPAIDYFIADPYVLPESAQSYYSEKIWRLPQTYIAVQGFEYGVPTIRRNQLGIPEESVTYFTGQRGYKRHPETVRLQMQIIKNVPNSYLLIKGVADPNSTEELFYQLAESEGIDCDRLKFLPLTMTEIEHRANLTIADVVLDTYPYNGATTTLETLWMGIPIVTRVGEQFASRNTYTMMINAGLTEGIAWTDQEYVEWGVKLGTNSLLRQEISWKLKESRKSAPIWNARQFTREMEKAYQQMWEIYTS
jgi:predicted O-linked N-acetylglucosamine transferase (SPINDLY family)